MKCLEDRYIVAKLCKVTCTGKSGRTGTDNSNLLAVLFLSSLRNKAVLSGPVGNETLQLTDGNCFTLDTAYTFALTLALLRTYTSTYSRKCGRQCDRICSILIFSCFYFTDKSRNIDIYRTSGYTSCIFTV